VLSRLLFRFPDVHGTVEQQTPPFSQQ